MICATTPIIGADAFFVRVGAPCSGIEGFVLVTVFLVLYVSLFRQDLRFPQVLLLFPLGLVASWMFNVLRITVLLVIGIEGEPELAVGGFHSHAGWLTFTLLSLLLISLSRTVPAFAPRTDVTTPTRPGFLDDPAVAQIGPFIVFMASGLLASTFIMEPALAYPLRAAAMAIALWLVRGWFLALPWRLDPVALGTGLVIGLAWLFTSPAATEAHPVAGLGAAAAAFWVVTRLLGTVVFVPAIEEALFRGYLIERIAPTRKALRMVLAVIIGAVLFAALHDRWLAAGIAGLVFGALVWRSDNLTDAILSHAAANATIGTYAVATGAWHVI